MSYTNLHIQTWIHIESWNDSAESHDLSGLLPPPYLETNPQISPVFWISMLSLWEKLYQAHTSPKFPENKTQKEFSPKNPKKFMKYNCSSILHTAFGYHWVPVDLTRN